MLKERCSKKNQKLINQVVAYNARQFLILLFLINRCPLSRSLKNNHLYQILSEIAPLLVKYPLILSPQ